MGRGSLGVYLCGIWKDDLECKMVSLGTGVEEVL